MEIRSRDDATPFTTADGSTIRVLLDAETGTRNQSLAEAWLEPGQGTQRHYHALSEELYVVLDGEGEMEVDGERSLVAGRGDPDPARRAASDHGVRRPPAALPLLLRAAVLARRHPFRLSAPAGDG